MNLYFLLVQIWGLVLVELQKLNLGMKFYSDLILSLGSA